MEATETTGSATVVLDEDDIELPDVLTELQNRTRLTRRSVQRILSASGRLDDLETPLGSYNPDWAVLVDTDEAERVYFVVETKSSSFLDDLRITESAKIACGRAHFSALEVRESPARYEVTTGVDKLPATAGVRRLRPLSPDDA